MNSHKSSYDEVWVCVCSGGGVCVWGVSVKLECHIIEYRIIGAYCIIIYDFNNIKGKKEIDLLTYLFIFFMLALT